MVRPRVLRHRVTVITLCPLGEPEIAIGYEPRIEPWLPRNRIACQVSRIDGRCHHEKMNRGNGRGIQRRTSRAIESHLHTVGWISRQKTSQLPAEGEVFLLTSPFIELPISFRDWWCEEEWLLKKSVFLKKVKNRVIENVQEAEKNRL